MARLLLTPDSPGDETPKKKGPLGHVKCRGSDAWLRTPQITQFPSGPIDILTWGRCRVKMKAGAMCMMFGMSVEQYLAAKKVVDEFESRRQLAALGVQFSADTMDRLTEPEVAKLLRCSAKTVQRRAERGAFHRYHEGGRVYYLKHEIEGYQNGVNISETV